jgi:hypothetical protein
MDDQGVVGMPPPAPPEVEADDHHADDEQARARSRARNERRGARPGPQAGPDPDEHDAQGEERGLALEGRLLRPDVAEAAQPGQDEERAQE